MQENAQLIADTHRAVSMLANCVVEGNVVVGTLACRALCNMPLSENLPESGNVAHVRSQWFLTSTYLTQVCMTWWLARPVYVSLFPRAHTYIVYTNAHTHDLMPQSLSHEMSEGREEEE